MKKLIFAIAIILFVFGCTGNQVRLTEKNLAEAEATIRSAKLMGAEIAAPVEIEKAERLYEIAEEDFYNEPRNRLLIYLRRKAALNKTALQNAQIAKQLAEKAIIQTTEKNSLPSTRNKSLTIEIGHLKDRNQQLEKEAGRIKAQNTLLRKGTEKLKTKMQTLQVEKKRFVRQAAEIKQPVQKALLKDPGDLYRKGFYLYQTRKYDAARKIFQQYLVTYIDSLSDNAQYWIGECYYMQQKYELSVEAFEAVLSKFRDSNKIPDTLLKLGLCHHHLTHFKKAGANWQLLTDRYPKTRAAEFAGKFLARQKKRQS